MPYQQSNPADDDGYDPNKAFDQRRQMYLNVQEIQRLEHEAINRISKAMVSKKTELLEILSAWLMNQTGYSSEHNEAEAVSGCVMQEWLTLQKEAAPLEAEANSAKWAAEAAERSYKEVAPLGHIGLGVVNEFFADGDKKDKIAYLALEARVKGNARDEATRRLASNVEQRQRFGKLFLRGCISNIQHLDASSVFGTRARTITGEMTRTLEMEWQGHSRATASAMALLDNNLDELRRIYRIKGE